MSETYTPNPAPAEQGAEAAETTQTPVTPESGTEQKATAQTEQHQQNVETVDYRAKFIESSKGAHALLERNKQLEAELAEARGVSSPAGTSTPLPSHSSEQPVTLYPGFEELDENEQKRVTAFAESVRRSAIEEINSRPSLAFAEKQYNESRWEEAFSAATSEFPELTGMKDEFKSKYFHPNNVPDNIGDILKDMAKVHLFDKARQLGAEEAAQVAERVELENPTGGDKQPTATRSLADWQALAQQNPAKFAELKDQYEQDLKSGNLKE